jgi:hypothetical protein
LKKVKTSSRIKIIIRAITSNFSVSISDLPFMPVPPGGTDKPKNPGQAGDQGNKDNKIKSLSSATWRS